MSRTRVLVADSPAIFRAGARNLLARGGRDILAGSLYGRRHP